MPPLIRVWVRVGYESLVMWLQLHPYYNFSMTGDGIIGRLYNADEVFMPWAISPYGKWSPTIRHFFFGTAFETQFHYDWPLTRPYAAKMHRRSIAHPCSAGIVHLAEARWRATKPK